MICFYIVTYKCDIVSILVPHWCHISATLVPHWCHIGATLFLCWCHIVSILVPYSFCKSKNNFTNKKCNTQIRFATHFVCPLTFYQEGEPSVKTCELQASRNYVA